MSTRPTSTIPAFRLAELLLEHAAPTLDIHPRWAERAARHRSIGTDFDQLAASDETWIEDLGLRQSPAPREFFEQHACTVLASAPAASLLRSLPSSDHATRRLAETMGLELSGRTYDYAALARHARIAPDEVAQAMTCWVNHFGSWDDAAELAGELAAIARMLPRTQAGARVLTTAANVLAGRGDERARELYDLAFHRWHDPLMRAFVRLRAAVAEVKRLGAPERIAPALDATAAAVATLRRSGKPGDAACVEALLENLRALVHVRAGDRESAEAAVRRAWAQLDQDLPRSGRLSAQVLDEFRIQVLANLGLATGLGRGWDASLELFGIADDIARRQGRIGFRVETASLLGYALTRLERYDEAVEVLTEAEALADGDVTPIRQRHVWELLAVAADGAGNADAADRWLGRLAVA